MSTATTRLRVRFKETDQMGVVHHSEYPVWLEVARIEWLRERGLSYRELEDSGISLAVSELAVTYRAAARFDDLQAVLNGGGIRAGKPSTAPERPSMA